MLDFNKKTVLVTGASGLIGSNLTHELLNQGAIVIAMGRSLEKLKKIFDTEKDNKNLIIMTGNVSVGIQNNFPKVDFIFHAASPISGMEIKDRPVETITANLTGTINCLELLRRQESGRLIVFSSATVYGNQFDKEKTVNEEETICADALDTVNAPYSESKRMIEVIARSYSKQYGIDTVIVRIAYVYGFVRPTPNTAFYEFINKAVVGENIVLNNSGMARRDNIHVNDVIKGLLLVALKGENASSYNISSNGERGNYKAIDEMAEVIANVTNTIKKEAEIRVLTKTILETRKPGMKLDNSKLKKLGWSVEISLQDGIKDTIEKFIGGQ